jgi:hypothetical protein
MRKTAIMIGLAAFVGGGVWFTLGPGATKAGGS